MADGKSNFLYSLKKKDIGYGSDFDPMDCKEYVGDMLEINFRRLWGRLSKNFLLYVGLDCGKGPLVSVHYT